MTSPFGRSDKPKRVLSFCQLTPMATQMVPFVVALTKITTNGDCSKERPCFLRLVNTTLPSQCRAHKKWSVVRPSPDPKRDVFLPQEVVFCVRNGCEKGVMRAYI